MDIIFGGAYQGKLDIAMKKYQVEVSQVYNCNEDDLSPDFDKLIINNAHHLVLGLVKRGENPSAAFRNWLPNLSRNVLIFNDISCGIVPLNETIRAWREENGRVLALLCKEAGSVTRVFCGLESRLK